MGFFSDLGKGIGNVIKAPFEGVGALAQGIGNGIGAILHGSSQQNSQQYLAHRGQQACGCNPQMAQQLQMLQQALIMNMQLMAQGHIC